MLHLHSLLYDKLFPAWAGVILVGVQILGFDIAVPRMGGGDPPQLSL